MPEVTPIEQAQLVQEAWDEMYHDEPVTITVPGTFEDLSFDKLTTEENRVSVWINGSESESPDFVIVNPPTEVALPRADTVYDPIGAIAVSIQGALK